MTGYSGVCAPLRGPGRAALGAGAIFGVLGGLLTKAAAVGICTAHRVSACTIKSIL